MHPNPFKPLLVALSNVYHYVCRLYELSTCDPVLSYSQNGEDLVLDRLLASTEHGFYVDIGAHHPTRFSNTYLFYRRGWRGINIDSMPGYSRSFHRMRPRDLTIECGVGYRNDSMKYFLFNEPALNTFNKGEALQKISSAYHIINTCELPVKPLADILSAYLDLGQRIDFLSVDVEGMDFEVLSSNDWQTFRPRYVLVEILRTGLPELSESETTRFLCAQHYRPICKVYDTVFFKDSLGL
jgi:FkbM family methyltransferase